MKIAVVAYHFPVLSETFVINHVNSLIESGHSVTVFSFNPKPAVPVRHPQYHLHDLESRTVYGTGLPKRISQRISRLPQLLCRNVFRQKKTQVLKTLNILRYGKAALNLKLFYQAQLFLNDNEFDIIHCHFGNVGNDVQLLQQAGFVKGKIVVSFHGYELRDKSIVQSNNRYRDVFRNCHRVVANSGYTFHQLADLGCPVEKLCILPVAPSNVFEKTSNPVKQVKQTFNVLTIARLEEVKGIEYGLKAIEMLKKKYGVDVVYDIVGDGELRQALEQQVKESQLNTSVVFHGAKSQAELPGFLSRADVFLLPSLMETQGLVLIEAQMMGVPVVASKTGGIPDSMSDGNTGFLVEIKNPQQIADALYFLYKDEPLRKKLSEAGISFATENFSAKSVTQKMNLAYEKLLETAAV